MLCDVKEADREKYLPKNQALVKHQLYSSTIIVIYIYVTVVTVTKSADSAADPFRQDGGELNVTVSNFTIYMICLSPHAGYNNKKR